MISLKTCFDTLHENILFEVRSLKSAVGCLRFRKCSIGPELCGEKLYVEFHGTNLILDFFKKSYLWFWNMLFLWSRSQCPGWMPCLSQSCRASRQSMILLSLHNISFDSNLGFWRCDKCKCLVSTVCVSLCCIFWYCTGVSTHLHAQTVIPI